MAQITISQAINWKKTLQQRHAELIGLRNQNSVSETRYFNETAKKDITPVYSVKQLDALVGRVAREIRLVDDAIKAANAVTIIPNYNQDDAVLGELELGA